MFSTEITSSVAHEHANELRDVARFGRRRGRATVVTGPADVTIRVAAPGDHGALEQLAQLDSRPAPTGRVLVAEVAGELRAAMTVEGGDVVADPFHPTAALIPLLALRARQLRAGELQPARATGRPGLVVIPNR